MGEKSFWMGGTIRDGGGGIIREYTVFNMYALHQQYKVGSKGVVLGSKNMYPILFSVIQSVL
jgi:hypothetical protein